MINRYSKERRKLLLAATALPFMGVATPLLATAQEIKYPTKAVRLIVPFAAGGGTDIAARLVGQKLADVWGQPVTVENQGGAGGNIGAGFVARAPNDGYTLLVTSGSIMTVNPHLYKNLPFDSKRDFTPITNLVSGPHVLIVHENFPAKDLKEFIAVLKSKPGQYSYASAGLGSQVHMATEQLLYAAGLEATHIPYRGEGAIYPDLLAERVSFATGNISAVAGQLASGRLRAIAVTSAKRSEILPNVPTMAESGLDGFENTAWFGLVAPAQTPQEIVNKVYKDVTVVLGDPATKKSLLERGVVPVGNSPTEFAAQISRESDEWGKIIASRGLTI